MAGELLYLDASALVKLVAREPESGAVQALVEDWPLRVSSRIAVVELTRAIARASVGPRLLGRGRKVLAGIGLVEFDAEVADAAGTVGAPLLRALDAIHLASALSLGADVGALVSYDRRLTAAASDAGLAVLAPA